MIDSEIEKDILQRIKMAEQEHNVKVLYAIESGSRAWGFASPNSDYDVRFIYVHAKDWYLSIDLEDKRDVIEYPIVDEIDINGWDIRKALKLFSRSNPAFMEWINSPIIYINKNNFAEQMQALVTSTYSCNKGIYHYRSMAKTNYRGYLQTDLVPLKKYFYVLRPLLAIQWIEKYQEPTPIVFEQLRSLLTKGSALDNEIDKLLERKKRSLEKELAPAIPIINEFIEQELLRLENYKAEKEHTMRVNSVLNQTFLNILNQHTELEVEQVNDL